MNKTLILYLTRYGTSEKIASELARLVGGDVKNGKGASADDISAADAVVVVTGVYIGSFGGGKDFGRIASLAGEKLSAVVACGLTDPSDEKSGAALKARLSEIAPGAGLFRLRGAVLFGKLSLPHRMMMKMVCKNPELAGSGSPLQYGVDIDMTDEKELEAVAKQIGNKA